MNRGLGLGILVVGVILLVYGFSAADSVGSNVKEFFTGTPTDKSMFLLIGGALLTAIGLGSFFIGNRRGIV